MTRVIALAAGLALLAASRSNSAETAADGQVQQGAALYEAHCSICHGPGMEARAGMKDLRAFAGNQNEFLATVTTGNSIMPSFEGVFTPEELDALYAYVQAGGGEE